MTVTKAFIVYAAVQTIGGKRTGPHHRLTWPRAANRLAGIFAASFICVAFVPLVHAQQLTGGAPPPETQEPEAGIARWSNRPRFQFGDVLRLDLHARVQTDLRLRDDTEDPEAPPSFSDRLSVPRRRIGVDGVLFDRIEFQIERELREDDNPWRDVYADVRLHRSVRVRAGQFKVPFSLEQLTSAYDLDFASRAATVADLAPGRDIGVIVHGRVADQALKYEVGAFRFGNGIGLPPLTAADLPAISEGRTMAARITVAPLRQGKSRGSNDLEFGAAILQNNLPEGRYALPGHLVMGDTFFSRVFVNGTRTRMGLSGKWDAGRARFQGELIRSADTRLGQAIDGTDLSDLISKGWYVSGVVNVVKRRTRNRGGSPLGDVDIGVRLDRLTFGSANQADEPFLNPRADHVATVGKSSLTFGATWAANRWVKVQANAVRELLIDPLQLLDASEAPIWSTVLRFQIAM